ncbi:MAG TPA: hypothetical protein VG474_15620 [Solirubrobacteraceae bacterium]|nr:hypothetical protein [Solirubrobacteraceae bacterium]
MASIAETPDQDAQQRVTFADLVRIHFRWRRALRDGSGVSEEEQARLGRAYHEALACFEEEHGELMNAYWCSEVESAVALTAGKPNTGWLRRLLSVSPRFHRVSDWATKDEPDIAHALHSCDELAVRASEVLRGRSRRITIQLVMTSACHLLSVVDARSDDPRTHKAAVAEEVKALDELRRDYREAANGDAQLVYFGGMTIGIALLALLYISAHSLVQLARVEESTIIGCLVAGALGAVVSVIARINSGTFALDFDVSRGYTLFLGALRPVIGSIFGLLAYFMLTSGFVEIFRLPDEGTVQRFYFLCVIAFAAGFSERWAQDTLTGGLSGRGIGKRAPAPAPAQAQAQRTAPPRATTSDLASE